MLVRREILTMEEVNLDPTITSRKTSSSALSAVGSDYEIESIFGAEVYVNFKIFLFLYVQLFFKVRGFFSEYIFILVIFPKMYGFPQN